MTSDPLMPGVRDQQRWVLAALQSAQTERPGARCSASQLAACLNESRGLTGLDSLTVEDVLATVAALRLRPELRVRITVDAPARFSLAPATLLLASAVAVGGCSSLAGMRSQAPRAPTPAVSYFGTLLAPAKAERGQAVHLPVAEPEAVATFPAQAPTPTPKSAPAADARPGYFLQAATPAFPPRADAGIWSENLQAGLSTSSVSAPPPILAPSADGDGSLSLVKPMPSAAATSAVAAVEGGTIRFAGSFPTHASAAAPVRTGLSVPTTRMATVTGAPTVHQDVSRASWPPSSDSEEQQLVVFRNGSIVLDRAHDERLRRLAAKATNATRIELVGRVGNRTLTRQMERTAVSRAIAIRAALVAAGVDSSKIRIRAPKSGDLVVPAEPAHESNRSVTVAMQFSADAQRLALLP
jgi:hypothetical protein